MNSEPNVRNSFVWQTINILAAVVSLFVSSAVSLAIIISGDNTDVSVYADVLLPNILAECRPEKDIVAYAAFVVLFPVLYALFICLIRKIADNGNSSLKQSMSYTVSSLWLFGISAAFATFIFSLYFGYDYADKYLYGKDKFWLVLVCAVFVWVVCYAHCKGKYSAANEIAAVAVNISFLLFVLYAIGKYNYMFSGSFYNLHHYSAWWNPIYKVGSGLTLGDGFNELYGFYPYLVVPVLRLFGGVNQQSASLYLSLLYVIMAASLSLFCNRFFKNKLLGAFCVSGFFSLGPMAFFCSTEVYFQYYPTRALFVFVILGIIALYRSAEKFRKPIAAGAAVACALAIFWNVESGMVVTVVWSAFLIFDKALDHRLNDKVLLKRIGMSALSAFVSVILFVVAAETVTYIRSGILLGKEDILFGLITFSGIGFFMLPLRPGVWIGVFFALVYGLFITVPHLAFVMRKGEAFCGNRDNVTALFISSVAGLGSFMYFMGRSYHSNCMTFLPWLVLVSALLLEDDSFAHSFGRDKFFRFFGKFSFAAYRAVCFAFVSLSVVTSFMLVVNTFNKESDINTLFSREQPAFQQLADRIGRWTENECGGETPYVFNTYAVFAQELGGIPARENVYEQINWFRFSDAHSYIDFINAHPDAPFTIDESGLSTLKNHFLSEWETLESRYELADVYEWNMYVDEKTVNNVYLFVPVSM
ncbi:MAG: hypothetical protein J6B25_00760 [Clostridia bacterium]|nr:hypothetical protein [Clostridia bacterium]